MNHRSVDQQPSVGQTAEPSAWSSWSRRLVTLGLVAALVSPAIRNHDSLPLSTYPMYSSTRTNLSSYVTATAIDQDRQASTLSALTIAGSRDRLIAQSFLNDAVRRGDATRICAEIAERVDPELAAVEIATERHDTIARLNGDASLVEREVHASCEVSR
jgi:hypothetical protein